MKKALLLLLIYFAYNAKVYSQTPEIIFSGLKSPQDGVMCAGQKFTAIFNTRGSFYTGNKFSLQLATWGGSVILNLDTKDSSGFLVGEYPSDDVLSQLNPNEYYYIQIASTAPKIISNQARQDFRYAKLPKLTHNPISSTAIRRGTALGIDLTGTAMAPLSFTTSEGDNYYMNNVGSYNSTVRFDVYPQKSGEFKIKEIKNACGQGTVEGNVSLTVHSNTLTLNRKSNMVFCKGVVNRLRITKQGTWNTDNKFLLEFSSYSNDKIFVVEATENDGEISFTLPDAMSTASYNVVLKSTSPAMIGEGGTSVDINTSGSAELVPSTKTIVYGNSATLTINTSPLYPLYYELNDGLVGVIEGSWPAEQIVRPTQSINYKVKYSNTCGQGEGKNVVSINVVDGIKVEEVEKSVYCLNETVKLKFSTLSSTLAIGSTINVHIRFNFSTPFRVAGKVTGANTAEFVIPSSVAEAPGMFAIALSTDKLPIGAYTVYTIEMRKLPTARWVNPMPNLNLDAPKLVNLGLTLNGGGDYKVELSTGQTLMSIYGFTNVEGSFWADTTKQFSIKSVSNSCGESSNLNLAFNVSVAPQTSYLKIKSPIKYNSFVCLENTYDLLLEKTGNFANDTKFVLDIVDNYGAAIALNVAEFKNDKLSWKPSTNLRSYSSPLYLRPRAVNTQVQGEMLKIRVGQKPEVEISNMTILVDYDDRHVINASVSFATNDDNNTVTLTNGQVFKAGSSYMLFSLPMNGSTTTYTIKSVGNSCATLDINRAITAKYRNREIVMDKNNQFLCKGAKHTITFFETKRIPNTPKGVFQLEISQVGNFGNYTVLKRDITQSPIEIIIPESFKAGWYYIRMKDQSDSTFVSATQWVNYQTSPNIDVSTLDGKNEITINGGEYVVLKNNGVRDLEFSGYLASDQNQIFSFNSDALNGSDINFLPRTGGVYKLKTLVNRCGIYDGQSSIKVTLKPTVTWSLKTFSSIYCKNESYIFTLGVKGDLPTSARFKLLLENASETALATILEVSNPGDYIVKLPSTIKLGSYNLVLRDVAGNKIGQSLTYRVETTPNVIVSGSSIVNANQSTYISAKPVSELFASSSSQMLGYTLTNAQKGIVYYSETNPAYIPVNVSQSQVISLQSVYNECGVGIATGNANITVNAKSDKVVMTNAPSTTTSNLRLCAGSKSTITFATQGNFDAKATFLVQLSDINGENFQTLPSTPTSNAQNSLNFQIPSDLKLGTGYRFRVISNEANSTSTTNIFPLTIGAPLVAEFDTTKYSYTASATPLVNLRIKVNGILPVIASIGQNESFAKNVTIDKLLFEYPVEAMPSAQYKIFAVGSASCGLGLVGTKNIAILELVTGLEDIQSLGVLIGPNPASDYITINCDEPNIKCELTDILGNQVSEQLLQAGINVISLQKFNSGVYHVKISKANKIAVFKLIKTN